MSKEKIRSKKEWLLRLGILFLGIGIAQAGATLFILTSLGSDSFTTFVQGISLFFGLSIGTCHVIVLTTQMILIMVFTKGYIKPGTFINAFCGGPFIDFFMRVFSDAVCNTSPFMLRFFFAVVGCITLSLGISIIIKTDAGTGPNDLVPVILADKITKVEFRWIRVAYDFILAVVGFSLDGVIGLGTIIAVVLTGPGVQFFFSPVKRIIDQILGRCSIMIE
ncbi:MAG: YitT family protein [Flexilinea sp.]